MMQTKQICLHFSENSEPKLSLKKINGLTLSNEEKLLFFYTLETIFSIVLETLVDTLEYYFRFIHGSTGIK